MAQNSPAHLIKAGRFGALACTIAAASMVATPAYALETLPQVEAEPMSAVGLTWSDTLLDLDQFDPQAETAEYWGRRWRGRRYRRNRISGGDILAGAIIIGGIAAIASAANNNNPRRDREVVVVERDRNYDRNYNYRRNDRRTNRSTNSGSGIDNAVSICLNEIERDVRVDSVDGASRAASGWLVTGSLFNGAGFSCQIDNNGRISEVDYGGFSGVNAQEADGQWSQDRYASARAAMPEQRPSDPATLTYAQIDDEARPLVDVSDAQPQPAYPGDPLPGDEPIDGDLGGE
ncbi:MAG: hypothetical protein AAF697_13870 [Pseudomonadota bacterium]